MTEVIVWRCGFEYEIRSVQRSLFVSGHLQSGIGRRRSEIKNKNSSTRLQPFPLGGTLFLITKRLS